MLSKKHVAFKEDEQMYELLIQEDKVVARPAKKKNKKKTLTRDFFRKIGALGGRKPKLCTFDTASKTIKKTFASFPFESLTANHNLYKLVIEVPKDYANTHAWRKTFFKYMRKLAPDFLFVKARYDENLTESYEGCVLLQKGRSLKTLQRLFTRAIILTCKERKVELPKLSMPKEGKLYYADGFKLLLRQIQSEKAYLNMCKQFAEHPLKVEKDKVDNYKSLLWKLPHALSMYMFSYGSLGKPSFLKRLSKPVKKVLLSLSDLSFVKRIAKRCGCTILEGKELVIQNVNTRFLKLLTNFLKSAPQPA